MKKLLVIVFLAIFSTGLFAQVEYPNVQYNPDVITPLSKKVFFVSSTQTVDSADLADIVLAAKASDTINRQLILTRKSSDSLYLPRLSLATGQSVTTTAQVALTGLSAALVIGEYEFEAFIQYNVAATTTGARIGFTAGVNNVSAKVSQQNVATSFTAAEQIGYGTTISFNTSTNSRVLTNNLIYMRGHITATAAGTFQITGGSELAGIAVTFNNTSRLKIRKIN